MAGDGSAPLPNPPTSGRSWVDALWLVALAAWSAAWCLTAAPKNGITYDEPFYLDAGLESWRGWQREDGHTPGWRHEYAATHGVMPLPPDLLAIPLYVQEVRTGKPHTSPWKQARVGWARKVTLGWFWLLLFSAWRLGRDAGGPWAGRIASGLIAADPNFLAHACLATTDVAVTAALLAFARAVYAGRGGGWWRRVVLPGLWFGIATLCKLSALLYGGLILVALEVGHRFATGALSRPEGAGFGRWTASAAGATLRSVLAAAAVILIGIAVAVVYCGLPTKGEEPFKKMTEEIPKNEEMRKQYEKWGEGAESVPHAVTAFLFQWWSNSDGRPAFLDGVAYPKGYRWFFPVLLLMKTPVPIFLLLLVALLRPRACANALTFAALMMFAVLLKANLQTGVRLAFPALAVGYVALAVALARGYPRCVPGIGLPAVLALALTSAWVWPYGLVYLNQPSGGREAAPRRVSDSNLDWGQGLPELRAWHQANGRPLINVWYFGADLTILEPPIQRFPIEEFRDKTGEYRIKNEDDLRELVGKRLLAVSYTHMTLRPEGPPPKVVTLNYLKKRRPYARTSTFVIYDFREPDGPPLLE